MDEFTKGVMLGLLIGEGHFGGDGKQPHITLRMHVRHKPLFDWLLRVVPGSRLYGPYSHGGRNYYQWMVRGEALRNLVKLLDSTPWSDIDAYAWKRYVDMKRRYRLE
ncbi:MAG TPA: hypothetical protein EYP10_11255 [Armatimonadetes bacterium]|nr:hypothetical protein [Armatimonadota bacterium]